MLPSGWTLSSINEAVGNTPTEPAYAQVHNHRKWAIPWLEDDPGLLAPQLWLNRTLECVHTLCGQCCLQADHPRQSISAQLIVAPCDRYSKQAAEYGVSGLLGTFSLQYIWHTCIHALHTYWKYICCMYFTEQVFIGA